MSFGLLNATICEWPYSNRSCLFLWCSGVVNDYSLYAVTIHIGMVLILALVYQHKGVFVWKRSVSDVAQLDASTPSANVDVYSMKTAAAPYDSESLPPAGEDARGV